jgi:hypothetical protein
VWFRECGGCQCCFPLSPFLFKGPVSSKSDDVGDGRKGGETNLYEGLSGLDEEVFV